MIPEEFGETSSGAFTGWKLKKLNLQPEVLRSIPDFQTAQAMRSFGKVLWQSGIFNQIQQSKQSAPQPTH